MPEPEGRERPGKRVWFPGTSSLLSMAVHEGIEAAVLDEIGGDPVMIIDIVHDELTRRAAISGTAELAKAALGRFRPHWTVMDTGRFVTLGEVRLAQEDVGDGRTLTGDKQHWAESTIIALARRSAAAGFSSIKILLSEDYDARRVACAIPFTRGVSIHALLHERVRRDRMTAEAAAELGEILHAAGRGPAVTASDFADPAGRGLGRVARP
ncbi:MAG: hypothetical protein ACRDNZ_23965 [Streptosporangiaceae bacterium]